MLHPDSSAIGAAVQLPSSSALVAVAACGLVIAGLTTTPAIADDTVEVPQSYALKRVIEVEVTPMGLVLNLNSPVTSANLSHMSDVVFTGLDGVLCVSTTQCTDAQAPTTLLLRRIPPLKFKNQLPSTDGTRMLFITTKEGLYRFRIKPDTSPDYTLIEVHHDAPASLPGLAPPQTPTPLSR